MGLFGFSFGKKRKTSKRSKKVAKKPPARLLSICKRYKVKATRKSGGRRVYKGISALKKECLKKAMAMLKKLQKMKRSKSSFGSHTSKHRRRRRGDDDDEPVKRRRRRRCSSFGADSILGTAVDYGVNFKHAIDGGALMGFGRGRSRFGNPLMEYGNSIVNAVTGKPISGFGRSRFGGNYLQDMAQKIMPPSMMPGFGKRRRTANRKVAMKAFRSFYKRHCAGSRRSGFGNGGNPPLYASMGYEFCPNGMGGVLGANSTGLFPSPCTSGTQSSSAPLGYEPMNTTGDAKAAYAARQAQYAAKFGRRRRCRTVTRKKCRTTRRRVCSRRRRGDDDM